MEQKELITKKVMRLCICLQKNWSSLCNESNIKDLTRLNNEIEKKTCVLEVFSDESWVRNLSWYGGNHECPGYLQHIMQTP